MRLADLADLRAREGNAVLARELRRVPLFRDLPQADILAVFDCLSEVEVGAGAVLCRRGDAGDRAYILERGELEARLGLGPQGVALRRLGPGDVVGEMSLVTGQPRSADGTSARTSRPSPPPACPSCGPSTGPWSTASC